MGSRRSSEQTRLGQEAFTRLLRHGMDQGIHFIDTADLYGSHPYIRKALKGVPRDRYVLLSKIWVREEDWIKPSGGAVEEVERFRKELGTDVIDICLIHCVTNAKWPRMYARVCDELSDLKQKGAVRAIGVSCHDLGGLKVAAEHPWVDVIFARINNRGGRKYQMDAELEEVVPVLKNARAHGKAVVGMKLFGAGKITSPAERDASLQYVIEEELVDAMTIGMLKTEEVDDSVARIGKAFKARDAAT
jgi:predicted aldo/keto reductase-like oxidoreductase